MHNIPIISQDSQAFTMPDDPMVLCMMHIQVRDNESFSELWKKGVYEINNQVVCDVLEKQKSDRDV